MILIPPCWRWPAFPNRWFVHSLFRAGVWVLRRRRGWLPRACRRRRLRLRLPASPIALFRTRLIPEECI